MHTLLENSNLTLFFSLPFKPAGKFNLFFNGHIACALNDTVYHIVNPHLLKTDFLFSVMPATSWLFGCGGRWVERDAASPCYTHVYLYRKCESVRTVVYAAGISIEPDRIEHIRNRFTAENRRFKSGARKYNLLTDNCSSIIASALSEAGLISSNPFNAVPSFFFRHFTACHRDRVELRSIDCLDRSRFSLRRFCLGLWGGNPQGSMNRWMAGTAEQSIIKNRAPLQPEAAPAKTSTPSMR